MSTEFADLLDLDPDFDTADPDAEAVVPRFAYLLDDLSALDPPAIQARPLTEEAQLALALLGAPAGFEDLESVLGPWREALAAIPSRRGGQQLLETMVAYIWIVSDVTDQRMREFMTTLEPEVADTFVSTYDRILARGEARGRAQGQAELFTNLLVLKFGDLDEHLRSYIAAASTEQIAAWSRSLVGGTLTVDDLTT